jgi:hypothetical protein
MRRKLMPLSMPGKERHPPSRNVPYRHLSTGRPEWRLYRHLLGPSQEFVEASTANDADVSPSSRFAHQPSLTAV